MRQITPLSAYFVLAYLISWIVFVILALNHHRYILLFDDAEDARLSDALHALGAFGPLLAALIVLYGSNNKTEIKQIWSGYSTRKINAYAWFLALSPVLLFVIGMLVARITEGKWYDVKGFFTHNNIIDRNFILWLLPSITYGFGEEAGWRGYALPKLMKKHSAFKATSILTVFWVLWHVPSFFYRYNMSFGVLIGFVLGIYAGAILLTYIFSVAKHSILAVSIWHLLWDIVSMIDKEGIISAVMSTLIMIIAVVILLITKFTLDNKTLKKQAG